MGAAVLEKLINDANPLLYMVDGKVRGKGRRC